MVSFTNFIIAAMAASLALANPIEAKPALESLNNTTPSTENTQGRYLQAISLATSTDTGCSQGQRDQSAMPDGQCFNLPGASAKVWWFNSGCKVWFANDRNCGKNGYWVYNTYQCVNVQGQNSYQVYC